MNLFEQTILTGIARVIDHWQTRDIDPRHGDYSREGRMRYAKEKFGPKFDFSHDLADDNVAEVDLRAFLGTQPTPSEQTMASRAYRALEAAGLIQRLHSAWSDRTTQIRLLPAGRAATGEGSPEVLDA